MPKVTAEHRESRREQILVAAWKCFARNGFHATSMADVIAEADLSAGAVYLYFKSKDEIIVAVATQVFEGVRGRLTWLTHHEPPPSPAEIAAFLIRQPVLANEQAPGDLLPLLLTVWAEAPRNPGIVNLADQILAGLRAQLAAALQRWADAGGRLPAPATTLAPVLVSLVQGFVVQRVLAATPEPDDYTRAVTALFTAAGLGGRPEHTAGSIDPVE